jgi:hypothetical protein
MVVFSSPLVDTLRGCSVLTDGKWVSKFKLQLLAVIQVKIQPSRLGSVNSSNWVISCIALIAYISVICTWVLLFRKLVSWSGLGPYWSLWLVCQCNLYVITESIRRKDLGYILLDPVNRWIRIIWSSMVPKIGKVEANRRWIFVVG